MKRLRRKTAHLLTGLAIILLNIAGGIAHAQSAPTVTLTATPATVVSPGSSTLNWASTNASTCTASGGWTGTKAVSGSEVISNLKANTSFTLVCSGSTGSAQLSWTPPTQNTDGTPIAATGPGALTGYKIYNAPTSAGVPTGTVTNVPGGATSSFTLTNQPVGTMYYSVSAVNGYPLESVLTGPVSLAIVLPSASASASVVVQVKPGPPANVNVVQTAWDLKGNGAIKVVGTIKSLGNPCGKYAYTDAGGARYYEIDVNLVDLTYQPRPGAKIITVCAPGA